MLKEGGNYMRMTRKGIEIESVLLGEFFNYFTGAHCIRCGKKKVNAGFYGEKSICPKGHLQNE
jgi:hypothetical protein